MLLLTTDEHIALWTDYVAADRAAYTQARMAGDLLRAAALAKRLEDAQRELNAWRKVAQRNA